MSELLPENLLPQHSVEDRNTIFQAGVKLANYFTVPSDQPNAFGTYIYAPEAGDQPKAHNIWEWQNDQYGERLKYELKGNLIYWLEELATFDLRRWKDHEILDIGFVISVAIDEMHTGDLNA